MADTDATTDTSVMEKLQAYIRTRKGTVLAVEILLCVIIIICYAASLNSGYSTVAICEMVFASIFFVIYMMEWDKQFRVVHWLWSDFFRAVTGAVLFLVTSLICVIGGSGDGARMAGGVFGLLAGILLSYDTYTIFLELKLSKGRSAVTTDA